MKISKQVERKPLEVFMAEQQARLRQEWQGPSRPVPPDEELGRFIDGKGE